MPDPPTDDWPVVASKVEYECPWFTVGYDRVRRPDGELADYYWVDPGDAVAVLAVTDEAEVVLVEEYRPNLGAAVLTPPAGGCEADESFEAAAARELREETGFTAEQYELLTSFCPSARFRQEFAIVLATGLSVGTQELDAGEFIEVHVEPFETAFEREMAEPTLAWALTALLLGREKGLV